MTLRITDICCNDARLLRPAKERMLNFYSENLIYSDDLYKELGITKDDLDAIGEMEIE